MDAHNLAVVFGPTLIRVSEEDDMISSQGHFNKVVEAIIKSYEVVFDGEGLDTVDNEYEEDEEAQKTEDELSRDDSDSEEGKGLEKLSYLHWIALSVLNCFDSIWLIW